MAATRRRVGFIGVVVAGLLVLGTACSSSNKSSSSTTTLSISEQCSQLKSETESIQSEMKSMSTSLSAASDNAVAQLTQAQKDIAAIATKLHDMTVPAAIQSQWDIVANAFSTFSTAFSAVDMNNITQPSVQAQVTFATDVFNTPAVQQAGDAVDSWLSQNCGITSGTSGTN